MLLTFPLGARSVILQIFQEKVCNVADLPGGGLQYNTGTRPLCATTARFSYQIYVFEPVNNDVYGTCNLQTRCVRSTHARNTLSKFFGRQT